MVVRAWKPRMRVEYTAKQSGEQNLHASTSEVKTGGLHQARKKGEGQISRKMQFTISLIRSSTQSFSKHFPGPCYMQEAL